MRPDSAGRTEGLMKAGGRVPWEAYARGTGTSKDGLQDPSAFPGRLVRGRKGLAPQRGNYKDPDRDTPKGQLGSRSQVKIVVLLLT